MSVIRIPKVEKLGRINLEKGRVLEVGNYIEYEVPVEVQAYWNSLSERERETLCNMSLKENKDLRDIIQAQM